jgi:hypothetical protein
LGRRLHDADRALAQPPADPGWRLVAIPTEWTFGPNLFKDWCGQWFGPDSDDDYLLRAVNALLSMLPDARGIDPSGASATPTALSAPALRASAPIAGAWWVVDHADNDAPKAGPFQAKETATYARTTMEMNASDRQNEAWNLWVTFVPARGIDSPEGIETRSGSTAKPQEPGGEATRTEAVSQRQAQALRHVANEWADMATNGLEWLRNVHDGVSSVEDALENMEACMQHCREVNDRLVQTPPAPAPEPREPVAWVRFCSDGCYEGPVMHASMEEVRKTSGAWTPLYAASLQAAPPDPLTLRIAAAGCPPPEYKAEGIVPTPVRGIPQGVEAPDDGELESWRATADELLREQFTRSPLTRRAAHLLQNAYLFANKLRAAMSQGEQKP